MLQIENGEFCHGTLLARMAQGGLGGHCLDSQVMPEIAKAGLVIILKTVKTSPSHFCGPANGAFWMWPKLLMAASDLGPSRMGAAASLHMHCLRLDQTL